MVTRKPVAPPISTSSASQPNADPPYPTTPVQQSAKSTASSNSVYSTDLKNSPAFDLIDVGKAQQRARSDSDSSHGTWDSQDTLEEEPVEVEVPKPLQIRSSQQNIHGEMKNEESKVLLPESLRVGPQQGHRPTKSLEGQAYDEEAQSNPWAEQKPAPTNAYVESNNPYLQRSGFVGDSSQAEWQEVKRPHMPSAAPPPVPSGAPPPPPNAPIAPVELPTVKSPPAAKPASEWLSELSLSDPRPASWETAEVLSVPHQGQAPLPPVTGDGQVPSSQRPLSTWWQDPPSQTQSATPQLDLLNESPQESKYEPPTGPPPNQTGRLIDYEDPTPAPPRRVPEPINTSGPTASGSSDAVPETPGTLLKRQRNEHYQIKHMNWLDASSTQGARPSMRQSPVLTQNANGPCPLLALVNALVLSTPADIDTPLIETLRTREQVSLGLLLDAVFDELMSGRRGETANQLPDVSELYSFLLALHTGMNVNPRFVTPASTPRGSLEGQPPAFQSVHPMHRAQRKAGAFEETKEMRLYATFGIALVHGWTPSADSPAYEAFLRAAQDFETAQNIQFLESELEDKLRSEGLPPQEQQMLLDIQTIKAFLDSWPTQLTDYGLQTISESLAPGQFAILFRNDHFSTIYKEPKHGALMTLVTDQGYSTHDEIVWESLVDTSGAASEMFSGDFRVVSHNQDVRLNQGNSAGGEDGWQTVQSRNRYHGQRNSGASNGASKETPPPLPGPRPNQQSGPSTSHEEELLDIPDPDAQKKASEQEDHDLALALQLQEEEENQARQDEERRRREQQLSEEFLSNETEGPRPAVPPRRNGGRNGGGPTTGARPAPATPATRSNTNTPTARPPVNRPSDQAGDPDAPPSYEQAASDPPYRPAGATASGSMAQGNPLGAYAALRSQQQSAYSQNQSTTANAQSPISPNQARRRSDANRISRRVSQMAGPAIPGSYNQTPQRVGQAPTVKEADDRCVVM